MITFDLVEKYNKAVPRYTSYPTVPHWQANPPSEEEWISRLMQSYTVNPAISLYIHLPFCEALCTYCGCNKRITKNHKVEQPYIDAVIKEWDIYRSYFGSQIPNIKEIHLGGGTPTFFQPEEISRLIQHIKDSSNILTDYEFSFEAHPNSTTFEHLQELFDIGFRRLSIGVQDISPKIMKAINRFQTKEEIEQVTKWARGIGYHSVNYDIIYGLPFQNEKHIKSTADFVVQMRPDRIAYYSYAHVPWKSAGQRAFTIEDVAQGKTKHRLREIGESILLDNGYRAVGMDHFCLEKEALYVSYKEGKMHRNFMGYTDKYTRTSIALGASSISDSWDAYIQNEKHIETYQEVVNQGQLPIIKGHLLTSKENLMREVILNLMCQDKLSFEYEEVFRLIFPQLYKLEELVEDGLVYYDERGIQVLDKGKYFIRNICAALDPKLMESVEIKKQFSAAI